MTDEENAEEYVSPKVWGDTYYENCCGDWSNEEMKKAYLDGLAEGRKEKCFEQNKDGTIRPCEVMKENIILIKEDVKLKEEIEKMKKQNESLKNTLQAIATDTNEHIIHNVAQNELDKWG